MCVITRRCAIAEVFKMKYNVAVLGASSNPARYSYKAVTMLTESEYGVFPVHPLERPIDGIRCYPSLGAIHERLDTVTVYLSEKNSTPLIDEIVESRPRRVILNPGAENDELKSRCELAGIQVLEACTLVLVSTGQFYGLRTGHWWPSRRSDLHLSYAFWYTCIKGDKLIFNADI